MLLDKWNYSTHKYEPFESPARVTTLYSEDMVAEVDCAECGKRMPFGDGYTSRRIHNKFGFGYPVCEGCYAKEDEAKKAAGK
jgi:hypothetical protein